MYTLTLNPDHVEMRQAEREGSPEWIRSSVPGGGGEAVRGGHQPVVRKDGRATEMRSSHLQGDLRGDQRTNSSMTRDSLGDDVIG